MLFSETETAKQNQKFPFHCLGRFAVEGWGEETRGKCKEIFWFLHTRVRERVRGALVRITTQSERTRQFQATTRSARAISSSHQDSARNTFELCPIHTAKKHDSLKSCFLAERGGFEPPIPLRVYMISSHAHSTTLPPFRARICCLRVDLSC